MAYLSDRQFEIGRAKAIKDSRRMDRATQQQILEFGRKAGDKKSYSRGYAAGIREVYEEGRI